MTSNMTDGLSRRAFVTTTAVAAGVVMPMAVAAQSALDAIPDGSLREHIAWFIGALNDSGHQLTEGEVSEHFSPQFLDQVPADEVIGTIEQLRPALGTVTIGRIGSGTDASQAGVQLVGETGLQLLLTFWLDPENDLIGGMVIEPDSSSTPEATAVASMIASPVAAVQPPSMDEVLPAFEDAKATLLKQGRLLTESLVAEDIATVESLMTPEVLAALGENGVRAFLERIQSNIVHMELAEVGAIFDGHVAEDGIQGFFHQLGPGLFELAPQDPQTDRIPQGVWTGTINGALDIEVTFSGTADDLAATLSIPSQGLTDQPLANVRFQAERPLGSLQQERALPLGQATGNDSYSAAYEWGESELVISWSINSEGLATGLNAAAYTPLPPDSMADFVSGVEFRLPFAGTWLVIWGGDTEFLNYHAPVPSQRHAYDIVIWEDGATYAGDGTRNEQYYAWSQPVLAPADGVVVEVLDGQIDLDPNMIADPSRAAEIDPNTHPAGNHVVIETGTDEYLLLAHFQKGTITVAKGDAVTLGDVLGLVGSSGNSSEPHIHIHVQNQVNLLDPATLGLPLPFTDFIADGEAVESGMPQQGELIAPAM